MKALKNIFSLLLILMVCSLAAAAQTGETPAGGGGFWSLLAGYWLELIMALMAVIKIIVRITPGIKDDQVFGWIDRLIELIIPNITKKNG
jgi:hypothetical protein